MANVPFFSCIGAVPEGSQSSPMQMIDQAPDYPGFYAPVIPGRSYYSADDIANGRPGIQVESLEYLLGGGGLRFVNRLAFPAAAYPAGTIFYGDGATGQPPAMPPVIDDMQPPEMPPAGGGE